MARGRACPARQLALLITGVVGASLGATTPWVGPLANFYSDHPCPNIGIHDVSLAECESLCASDITSGCTAINWGRDATGATWCAWPAVVFAAFLTVRTDGHREDPWRVRAAGVPGGGADTPDITERPRYPRVRRAALRPTLRWLVKTAR
jgi:hypothetical protein